MEINKIVDSVLFRYPLFGSIIVNLKIKHTNEDVSAPAFTDGKAIYYRDEFLTDYDDEEKEFIISHEIFHIVLSHISRNIDRDQDLLNYVEDAIINQFLIRDGLKMPKGLVFVEEALDYSVEELYLKFLPKINDIKKWMGTNTYHIDLSQLSGMIQDAVQDIYNMDLQSLMSENEKMKLDAYKTELQKRADESKSKSIGYGEDSLGIEFPAVAVGTAEPLLRWQDILEDNLKVLDDDSISFYEVQMDGIIKKESKYEEKNSESEIIIDSSGSMDMEIIKVILRECKNILLYSDIKVGFCDTEFYGWNSIKNDNDIDELNIIGRGGTDFYTMVNSFSANSENKIIITDGMGSFPPNISGVLWIIIGYEKPLFCDSCYSKYIFKDVSIDDINYIFIDIMDIDKKNNSKKFRKNP